MKTANSIGGISLEFSNALYGMSQNTNLLTVAAKERIAQKPSYAEWPITIADLYLPWRAKNYEIAECGC